MFVKKIFKNTSYLFVSNLVYTVLNFFVGIYLARELVVESYGLMSLALVVSFLLFQFSEFGLNITLQKSVARQQDLSATNLSSVFGLRLVCSACILLLSVPLFIAMKGSDHFAVTVLFLMTVAAFIESLSLTLTTIFNGKERMELTAALNLSRVLTLVILVYVFLWLDAGLIWVCTAYVISALLKLALGVVFLKKRFILPRPSFDLRPWKDLLKGSIPYGLATLFSIINMKVDTVMLSVMQGDSAVAYYSAAYNIVVGFGILGSSFLHSIFPRLSLDSTTDLARFRRMYLGSLGVMTAMGCVIAVAGYMFSEVIIDVLYTSKYAPTVPALKILFFATWCMFMVATSGIAINSMDRPMVSMAYAGAMAAVNIVLNLLLIPRYSFVGASYATLFSFGLGFLLLTFLILRYCRTVRQGEGMRSLLFIHGNRGGKIAGALADCHAKFETVDLSTEKRLINKLAKVITKVARDGRPGIILVDDHGFIAFTAMVMSVVLRKPYYVRLRGDNWEEIEYEIRYSRGVEKLLRLVRGKAYLFLGDIALRHAEKVIPVSRFLGDITRERAGVREDRIFPIPVPLSALNRTPPSSAEVNALRRELDLVGKKVLLCITNFNFYKKVSGLATFMPELKKIFDEFNDAVLLVAGGGRYLERFRANVEDHGLNGRLRLLGMRSDVAALYSASDIFLHLSLQDAFPNVVLEAQSFRLPVIVNDFGGMREQILEDETGLVVRNSSAGSLTSATRQLLSNPSYCSDMGKKGLEFVTETFSVESVTVKFNGAFGLLN